MKSNKDYFYTDQSFHKFIIWSKIKSAKEIWTTTYISSSSSEILLQSDEKVWAIEYEGVKTAEIQLKRLMKEIDLCVKNDEDISKSNKYFFYTNQSYHKFINWNVIMLTQEFIIYNQSQIIFKRVPKEYDWSLHYENLQKAENELQRLMEEMNSFHSII